MNNLNMEELTEWFFLVKQLRNGYHLSDWDIKTFLSLNHKVMEVCHHIHNESMMGSLRSSNEIDYAKEQADSDRIDGEIDNQIKEEGSTK